MAVACGPQSGCSWRLATSGSTSLMAKPCAVTADCGISAVEGRKGKLYSYSIAEAQQLCVRKQTLFCLWHTPPSTRSLRTSLNFTPSAPVGPCRMEVLVQEGALRQVRCSFLMPGARHLRLTQPPTYLHKPTRHNYSASLQQCACVLSLFLD
jgi:hypothetical protein